MMYWNSFVNLKEVKKPCGKFLRVWAKNQLIFENFEFIVKNLNGKCLFYLIFLDICHLMQHWKITPFFTTIFPFSDGHIPILPCAPLKWNLFLCTSQSVMSLLTRKIHRAEIRRFLSICPFPYKSPLHYLTWATDRKSKSVGGRSSELVRLMHKISIEYDTGKVRGMPRCKQRRPWGERERRREGRLFHFYLNWLENCKIEIKICYSTFLFLINFLKLPFSRGSAPVAPMGNLFGGGRARPRDGL